MSNSSTAPPNAAPSAAASRPAGSGSMTDLRAAGRAGHRGHPDAGAGAHPGASSKP
jgi:hypothetical protein